MTRKTLAAALTTLAICAAAPVAASAADFHAAPSGSGTACSLAQPCTIQTAFASVTANGDQIVLAGGDYASAENRITEQLFIGWQAVAIKPEPGARPKLWLGGGDAIALFGANSSIAGVEIDYDGTGASIAGNVSTIDHVRIKSTNLGITLTNGTAPVVNISNTMVSATGEGGWGIIHTNLSTLDSEVTLNLRNVTVVDDGATSVGVSVSAVSVGAGKITTRLNVWNSIVRAAGNDFELSASNAADTATALIRRTSFGEVAFFGQGTTSATDPADLGNQTLAPVFVDRAAGDLHQAATSPTIDAGVEDLVEGATDLDGDARIVGSAIDMGADEYVAPPPVDPDTGSDDPGTGGDDPGTGGEDPGTGGNGGSGGSGGAGDTPPADDRPVATPTVPVQVPAKPASAPAAVRCVVPRLAGKSLKAAKAALIKAHCRVGKVKTKRARGKTGKVVTQGTKPGKRLANGTKVALVVGRR